MSSSLNCQVAPLSSILTESSNKNSISQTQPANIMYFSIIPNNNSNSNNNTSPNPIRKRKVKFMIQLAIEELLSVPYLNGVLFCKVRLCDGGHYVSYSMSRVCVGYLCVRSFAEANPTRSSATWTAISQILFTSINRRTINSSRRRATRICSQWQQLWLALWIAMNSASIES